MFVRNGQKLGSIIRDAVVDDEPSSAAEAEPRPGSKAALQAEAESLGLPTDGTKTELEERILEALGEGVDADGDDDA